MLPVMIEPMFADLGIPPYLAGAAIVALLMLIGRRSRRAGHRSSD